MMNTEMKQEKRKVIVERTEWELSETDRTEDFDDIGVDDWSLGDTTDEGVGGEYDSLEEAWEDTVRDTIDEDWIELALDSDDYECVGIEYSEREVTVHERRIDEEDVYAECVDIKIRLIGEDDEYIPTPDCEYVEAYGWRLPAYMADDNGKLMPRKK